MKLKIRSAINKKTKQVEHLIDSTMDRAPVFLKFKIRINADLDLSNVTDGGSSLVTDILFPQSQFVGEFEINDVSALVAKGGVLSFSKYIELTDLKKIAEILDVPVE